MALKESLLYKKVKEIRNNSRLEGKYVFEDRSRGNKKMLLVLSGYKQMLWPIVFDRIERFASRDWDVCIVSSGKYVDELSKIADKNNWSYISTKRNNLCLAQNIAINSFKNAEWICKMDEDVFITENTLVNLEAGFKYARLNSQYKPGYAAPMINVNNFSYLSLLERFNLVEKFRNSISSKLPKRYHDFNYSPESALFMWGEDMPHIDKISRIINRDKVRVDAVSTRFNIGIILFPRSLWKEMNYFKVGPGNGMSVDELEIDKYCLTADTPPVVVNNSFAGHFGFGAQSKEMNDFFLQHKEQFQINSDFVG